MEVQATERPEIEFMNDEELDSFIASPTEPKEEVTPTPAPIEEPKVEIPDMAAQGTDAPKEEATVPDPEKDKLAKQVQDKEAFIQRQAQELGELRRKSQEMDRFRNEAKTKAESVNDTFYDNPLAATEAVLNHRDAERQYAVTEQILREKETELTVTSAIPHFNEMKDEIAEIATADGYPPESVDAFKRNPWTSDASILVNYAHRVSMQRQVKAMQGEIETLKKKPEEVLRKIEEAAKGSKTLTAATGIARAASTEVSETQLNSMTDAELDEFLKNNQ